MTRKEDDHEPRGPHCAVEWDGRKVGFVGTRHVCNLRYGHTVRHRCKCGTVMRNPGT